MRTLDAGSTYLDLVWPFLITSAGIGLCVAPTTSAIMNAVPDEKQGVASAVNDTTREVGAAIGIAVAGSVLATTTCSLRLSPDFPNGFAHRPSTRSPVLLPPRSRWARRAHGCPPWPSPPSFSRWTCRCS
jgi:hypothetical protein